ncbi:MAG: hypothetical protein QM756_02140 [Polyangiaceae bacterium]
MSSILEFTVSLSVDDLDDDGVVEALLVLGSEHPEGVSSGELLYLVEPSGEQTPLPFDALRDQDGDGRLDATLGFHTLTNAAGCEPPEHFEAWVAAEIWGPTLMLHRLEHGKFTLSDAVSRAARQKSCAKPGGAVVALDKGGRVDETETLRRAVCMLADGGDAVSLKATVARACSVEYRAPDDCKRRRPGVCFWKSTLLEAFERFEAIRPWLATAP